MRQRALIQCDAGSRDAALALARTLRKADVSVRVLAIDGERAAGRRAACVRAIDGDEPRIIVAFGEGEAVAPFVDAVGDRGWEAALHWARPAPLAPERSIVIDRADATGVAARAAPTPTELQELDDWRDRYLDARLTPGLESKPARLLVLLQPDADPALRMSSFRTSQDVVRYLEGVVPAGLDVVLRLDPSADGSNVPSTRRRDFRFEASGRLHDRIAEAGFVIGVNGGGLLEAAFMGRPVAAFGPGPFSGERVVVEAPVGAPFPRAAPPDEARRAAFFHDLLLNRRIEIDRLIAGDLRHLASRRPFANWLGEDDQRGMSNPVL